MARLRYFLNCSYTFLKKKLLLFELLSLDNKVREFLERKINIDLDIVNESFSLIVLVLCLPEPVFKGT